MRAFVIAILSLGASLALVGSPLAQPTGGTRHHGHEFSAINLPWSGLSVGVNDDSAKIGSLLDWFYPTMSGDGLNLNALMLRWDPAEPFAIPTRAAVRNAIAAAQANGISIQLDLYQLRAHAFTNGKTCEPSADPDACGNGARIALFAGWTGQVAAAFPSVHQFTVMNECNQPLFLNPQWSAPGENQSAAICGRALAAAYDALKAADRKNFVWGIGLSPRGNDNARAVSNSSTSPVRFLGYLGAWFKAFAKKTHRTAPLMDGLDFHPYPMPQSLPFATGYTSTRDASVTNLPRIYQAFYDAFRGSPQRTIGPQHGGDLPVSLGDTGIQTAARGNAYDGLELSANRAGGVLGQWATQTYQEKWYLAMPKVVACDPNVRALNIFHLLDETNLTGWQSGLYFANEKPKQSASTVRNWITSTSATCRSTKATWRPGAVMAPSSIELSRLKLPGNTKPPAPRGIPKAAAPTQAAATAQQVETPTTTTTLASAAAPAGSGAAPTSLNAGPPADPVQPNNEPPPADAPPADTTPLTDPPPTVRAENSNSPLRAEESLSRLTSS